MSAMMSWQDSIPSSYWNQPATATNDNAVGANPATTASVPSATLGPIVLPSENVWLWLGIAGSALLLYKVTTERNTEEHVGDIRVSLTNGLMGSAFIAAFFWVWRLTAGAMVAQGGVLGTVGAPIAKFFN